MSIKEDFQKGIIANLDKKSFIGYLLMFVYVISSYIAKPPIMTEKVQQVTLYILFVFVIIQSLLRIKKLVIKPFSYWYFCFFLISVISVLYAIDQNVALNSISMIISIFCITYIFSFYADEPKDIINILNYFAISGVVLGLIMAWMGLLNDSSSRLGNELFGNSNTFAFIMMLSELCCLWLLLHGDKKIKVLYFLGAILLYYNLLLSGGKKYLIICPLFLYILIFLKLHKRKKIQLIAYTIIFIILSGCLIWAIFNIKPLYDTAGVRFERTLGYFIEGGNSSDRSTSIRSDMILKGFEYFKNRPILGYGRDCYKILYGNDSGWYVYSHNNYIEILVDHGLLGFIIYYSYYVYLIFQLSRIKEDVSKLRDFFLAFVFILLFFEIGAVTVDLNQVQIFMALSGAFVVMKIDDTRQNSPIQQIN